MAEFAGSILAVSLFIFLIVNLTPGDLAEIHNLSAATASRLNLDRPLPLRYALWLRDCLRLDFGVSLRDGTPVSTLLAQNAPATLYLAFASLGLSLLFSLPLGLYLGMRPRSPLGKLINLGVYGLSSVPVFVLAYVALAIVFGAFRFYSTAPPEGPFRFWPWAAYYMLPVLVLAIGNGTMGELVRFIALETGSVNGSLYLKAARARGVPLFPHFLRSLAAPVASILVGQVATLLGGLVVVERIFNFRGLGWLGWEATIRRDFYVVMGITLLMVFTVRLCLLAADLLARAVDPRLGE